MAIRITQDEDIRRWRRRLLKIAWWTILVVALVELGVFAMQYASGTIDDVVTHLMEKVLIPCGCNVLVLGVVHLLSARLFARGRLVAQAYVFVTGMSMIALNLAWAHRAVITAHTAFAVPILLTYVFVDRRPQGYAFVLNAILYTAFSAVLKVWMPDIAPALSETGVMFILLLVAQFMGVLMHDRQLSLIQSIQEANRMSTLDSLTRLYNHAAFYEHLDQRILRQARGEGSFCLIVFDIDDFKGINDQYGHDVGDEVLLALVAAIRASLGEEDTAFRYGGEEFTVLTGCSLQNSFLMAEAIRRDFTARAAGIGEGLQCTVSAGVCAYDAALYNGRREFFAAADEALYEAKRTGKDRTVIWTRRLLDRPQSQAEQAMAAQKEDKA